MNKKVLVLRGDSYRAVGEMFARHGYDVTYDTSKLSEVNLVVFTGGSDVSPYIYGEEPDGARGCDSVRDEFEVSVYGTAKSLEIPMVGICRGGQLLNVLNGGKMIQHLGKTISGVVYALGYGDDASLDLLVDHHQGILLDDSAIRLAIMDSYPHESGEIDYAGYYPKTKSLCFQPHPEWGHKWTENYFFELVNKYVVE